MTYWINPDACQALTMADICAVLTGPQARRAGDKAKALVLSTLGPPLWEVFLPYCDVCAVSNGSAMCARRATYSLSPQWQHMLARVAVLVWRTFDHVHPRGWLDAFKSKACL